MTTYESAADAITRPAVGFTRMQTIASGLWASLLVMGIIIMIAALVIGIVNGQVTGDYFTFSKGEREAAGEGSDIAGKKVFIESTLAWLPQLKFLGLGLILGGITFLLATVLGTLRVTGATVQQSLESTIVLPHPPIIAKVFPILMMIGLVILIAALILGIVEAAIASNYWDHSIATELNEAKAGSDLLSDLGTLQAMDRWLSPVRFIGIAFLLTGIALALTTIIWTLRFQSRRLLDILAGRP